VSSVDLSGALWQEDASTDRQEPGGWVTFVRPYLWLPRISGSLTVNGLRSRVLITQGDLLKDLQAAALLNVEATKGDHYVRFDTVGFALEDDENIPGVPDGRIDHRVEMASAELDVGVRLLDDGEQTVDVFTGLRLLYIKVRVNPKNVGVQGDTGSARWVDPIVGTRYRRTLSDTWTMILHADYGGFGIGNASTRDYQVYALAACQLGDRWQIGTGWRYIMVEHSQGSGTDRQRQHLRFSGPVLGVSYRF
jgi:hypothetical protein